MQVALLDFYSNYHINCSLRHALRYGNNLHTQTCTIQRFQGLGSKKSTSYLARNQADNSKDHRLGNSRKVCRKFHIVANHCSLQLLPF